MEKKKKYIKPVTEIIVAMNVPKLLAETWKGEAFEPAKQNNSWNSDEDDDNVDSYGYHRVGSHKGLWDD